MRTISVAVSEEDYEAFRRAADDLNRPIAQLIREAMAVYRAERFPERSHLVDLPVLAGHRPLGDLPSRSDICDDVYNGVDDESGGGDAPVRSPGSES